MPGAPKPPGSGRKKGVRNKGTELVKAAAKSAVEIARNGGKSPIEIVVEGSRFFTNLAAFGQSKLGRNALEIYEALWTHDREREIIVDLVTRAIDASAKIAAYSYPRLAAIEWIGDAPSAVHNDNRVIITMNLGDGDGPQTVIDGEAVGEGS
jgi:hypothetical protein